MKNNAIQCSQCEEAATVFVSYVGNGKLVKKAYCQKHAREAGVLEAPAWDLAGDSKAQGLVEYNMLSCKHCGHTQRDFERTGRVGCEHCYDLFEPYLKAIIKRIQRKPLHIGKVPRKALQSQLAGNRIKYLQEQMEQAVSDERYEEAARFRDEITEIQSYTIPEQDAPYGS